MRTLADLKWTSSGQRRAKIALMRTALRQTIPEVVGVNTTKPFYDDGLNGHKYRLHLRLVFSDCHLQTQQPRSFQQPTQPITSMPSSNFSPDSLPDLTGRVYLVTGGNTGMSVVPHLLFRGSSLTFYAVAGQLLSLWRPRAPKSTSVPAMKPKPLRPLKRSKPSCLRLRYCL